MPAAHYLELIADILQTIDGMKPVTIQPLLLCPPIFCHNLNDMLHSIAAKDSGKPMVDAAFGEVMVTCEKLAWLLRQGERYLKPERRSAGSLVSAAATEASCPSRAAMQIAPQYQALVKPCAYPAESQTCAG